MQEKQENTERDFHTLHTHGFGMLSAGQRSFLVFAVSDHCSHRSTVGSHVQWSHSTASKGDIRLFVRTVGL